jgi:mRNA-degrading endonuclease RelE of RelBE toxin-antitoxin system
MRLIIDKSYIKDVRHLNHTAQTQAAEALESILDAQSFSDIPHLKPLKGQLPHY